MTVTTISARDFSRDMAKAKRAASDGPVFITDRGEPRYVLLNVDDYFRCTTGRSEPTLLEALQVADSPTIAFTPSKFNITPLPVDLIDEAA